VACKEDVLTAIHWVRSKQKERTEMIQKAGKKTVDVLKLTAQIGGKLPDLEKLLDKMNNALRAQRKDPKKYSQAEVEMKEKVYNNCMNMFKDISNMEKQDTSIPQREIDNSNTVTLGELQQKLLSNRTPGGADADRSLTEDESAAIEKFKQKDKEMDVIIEQINSGLYTLKDKADLMGTTLDRQTLAMDSLGNEIDNASKQLESSNAKLKQILEKFRSPSKFCMDVVMILLLLGLVSLIVKMATGSSSSSS